MCKHVIAFSLELKSRLASAGGKAWQAHSTAPVVGDDATRSTAINTFSYLRAGQSQKALPYSMNTTLNIITNVPDIYEKTM